MPFRISPFPWRINRKAGKPTSLVDRNGHQVVSFHLGSEYRRNPERVEANAQLLHAAPELREELLHLLRQYRDRTGVTRVETEMLLKRIFGEREFYERLAGLPAEEDEGKDAKEARERCLTTSAL